MIIERYDPVNLFELVPRLQLDMEPQLHQLDQLLQDNEWALPTLVDPEQRWDWDLADRPHCLQAR